MNKTNFIDYSQSLPINQEQQLRVCDTDIITWDSKKEIWVTANIHDLINKREDLVIFTTQHLQCCCCYNNEKKSCGFNQLRPKVNFFITVKDIDGSTSNKSAIDAKHESSKSSNELNNEPEPDSNDVKRPEIKITT